MRLLDVETKKFVVVEHPQEVSYAILSHVWSKPGGGSEPEPSYHELLAIQAKYPDSLVDERELPRKIRMLCRVAQADGFRLAWLDSGCIDRSSSAELSEAINSMYDWYRYSQVCYAYLDDVRCDDSPPVMKQRFFASVWFQREWTLQELIAPDVVIFLSAEWAVIGTKHSLADVIEEATRIDAAVLTHKQSLDTVSVAKRMSWAARRKTTKVEDEAYCLLGIFGVHIATVYGEGSNAFVRLQEEICRHIPDQTIFAWGSAVTREDAERFAFSNVPQAHVHDPHRPLRRDTARAAAVTGSTQKQYLFATSPSAFRRSYKLRPISPATLAQRLGHSGLGYPAYTATSHGLHTRFPLVAASSPNVEGLFYLAFLACEDQDGQSVALLLRSPNSETLQYVVGNISNEKIVHANDTRVHDVVVTAISSYTRIVTLPTRHVSKTVNQHVSLGDVYIPSRPSRLASDGEGQTASILSVSLGATTTLQLAPWSVAMLKSQQYRVEIEGAHPQPAEVEQQLFELGHAATPLYLRISDRNGYIRLFVGRCPCQYGQNDGYLSILVLGQDPGAAGSIQRVQSTDHDVDHSDHVSAWPRHACRASRELHSIGLGGVQRTVRLCVEHGSRRDACEDGGGRRPALLVLSVEIQQRGSGSPFKVGAPCADVNWDSVQTNIAVERNEVVANVRADHDRVVARREPLRLYELVRRSILGLWG
ncbi:heterokaryon incompatibility protein-domain-containing protein [Trametes elegans]|nr:heterokaryon incompatibility protein-domain-containing protein [Trametes elegans]